MPTARLCSADLYSKVMTLSQVGLSLGKESTRGEAQHKCDSSLNTVPSRKGAFLASPRLASAIRFDHGTQASGSATRKTSDSEAEHCRTLYRSLTPAARPFRPGLFKSSFASALCVTHVLLPTAPPALSTCSLNSRGKDRRPPKMTTTMSNIGKSALRVAKNSIKGYSDTQTKIRDATSNDPWGPSGTQMAELAQLTYNQQDFVEIIEMLEKRLNDKGKNWRHVFKSLTVLDYLLHAGSENVVHYFRYVHCCLTRERFFRAQCLTAPPTHRPPRLDSENLYVIKTLKEFQHIDDDGKDQGANGQSRCALGKATGMLTASAPSPSSPKGQRHHQPSPRREAHDAPTPHPQRYAQPHGRRTFLFRQRPPESRLATTPRWQKQRRRRARGRDRGEQAQCGRGSEPPQGG